MVSTNRPGGVQPRYGLQTIKSAEGTKEFFQERVLRTFSTPFFSDDSHAAGDAQGGGDGREDGGECLNDEFPSLFLHSRLVFLCWLIG